MVFTIFNFSVGRNLISATCPGRIWTGFRRCFSRIWMDLRVCMVQTFQLHSVIQNLRCLIKLQYLFCYKSIIYLIIFAYILGLESEQFTGVAELPQDRLLCPVVSRCHLVVHVFWLVEVSVPNAHGGYGPLLSELPSLWISKDLVSYLSE
jgi:hypothetical protein